MKVVAMIPYWLAYESGVSTVPKNLVKLGGMHPLNYSIHSLNLVEGIEEVFLYCSDEQILTYLNPNLKYKFLPRPKLLDASDVVIEDIIDEFISVLDADIIVMLHPNSPFLKPSTISECLKMTLTGGYDSAFTAYEFKKLTWFKGKPLNYDYSKPTPHLKDLDPVIFEQSSLYIFSSEQYKRTRKRVGRDPYIKLIDHFEGHEINVVEDYKIAELIVNSGMYSEY